MKTIIIVAAGMALAGAASAQQLSPSPVGEITRAAAIADAERRFAALDEDGSGRLDAPELAQAPEQRRTERRQRMEERLGRMSAEERAGFEQRRVARGGEERRAEERGGGPGGRAGRRGEKDAITLAEFRVEAERRFDRLDLDRNGVITAAERAQLRARQNRGRD